MAEIHQLTPEVYNKISAGEVIAKPASVVKELVENALDAGAGEIVVRFAGGGLERIVVSDDGKGIAPEDMHAVFLPHATSKISTADDLNGVVTLGFRGEAMASIAAAAMVHLVSRRRGAEAYHIDADGGKIGQVQPASGAFGTEVEVRNLFYHTPARLKFLRSAKQEGRDILTLCERFIIANPTVKFAVYNEDKLVYRTTGAGAEESVRVVFGEEAFAQMLPVEHSEYGYTIRGYVSNTDYSAGTKASQITVLNGRVVANANLSASINNAYRDFLIKRNYALYALHITMPADEVDVNVHPTKADVRFEYTSKIVGLAYRVVRKALEQYLQTRDIIFDEVATPAAPVAPDDRHIELQAPTQARMVFAENSDFFADYAAKRPRGEYAIPRRSTDLPTADEPEIDTLPPVEHRPLHPADEQTCAQEIPDFDPTALRIVGQVLGTYIVAEYAGDMMLVDQHAAAERVLYNRLMAQYADKDLAIQPMLVPYEFELSEEESALLGARLDDIRALGIEIEAVGECGFALHAVPTMWLEMDAMQFVHLLLADNFEASGKHLLHERIAYAACRAALKGNTYMDNDQLLVLCKTLFGGNLPAHCPHGRPAYVKVSRYELEKMFKRIV